MSIVQSGLTLNLDAGNTNSYLGTGTLWTDLSGNNNNGTLVNSPTFDYGYGGGIVFDGLDEYINTNYDLSWNNTNSVSISITLTPSNITQNLPIIGKGPSDWEWQLNQRGSGLQFVYWNTGGGHANGPITIIPNFFETNVPVNICLVWNHVDNKHYFYKNGINVGENTWVTASTNQNRSTGIKIGGSIYRWGTTLSSTYWLGKIHIVMSYNRALSSTEALQNYNATKGRFGTNGLVLNLDAGNTNSYPGTGTLWTDLSGNNNNGTLVNTPTFNSANGGSVVFDGVDEYVNCGNASNLQITVGSVSAWVKTTTPGSGYRGIITKQNAWGLFVHNGILATYDWNTPGIRSTGINISDGTWKNVVMTFTQTTGTPSNNVIIYLNGNPVLTTTVKHVNHTINVELGRGGSLYGGITQFLNGSISEAKIYNRVLTSTEALQNYNATKGRFETIVQSGPILHLDAGNTSSYTGTGTLWTDLSGNNNNGTLVNTPTFNSANGGSIVFDGTNEYVLGSSNYSINSTQPFTMEFWANLSTYTPIYPCLFQIKTNTTHSFIVMVTQASGYNGITFGSTSSWVTLRNNGNQLSTNIWYNIVITYNGNGSTTSNNYKMYINTIEQTLVGSSGYVNLSQINNIGTIENGSRGTDNWNGRIPIVKLYNRTLSSTEVLQNYNDIKGRFETTLQSSIILHLDAGNINSYPKTGIVWTDLSGNGNIGTLVNGPTFDSANLGSIVFDGIDDYASISGPNFFTTPNPNLSQQLTTPTFDVAPWYPVYDNFTYEFVCKPTSGATIVAQSTTGTPGTSGQRYITNANKSTDAQNNGNFVISVGTNAIQVFDHGDAYMPCLLSYTVNISSNVHIVITVVNKQPSLYINGVFIKTGLTSPKTKVELSGRGPTVSTSVYGRFSGNVNIYKYHNRVLSSQEILQNYDSIKGRFQPIVQSGPILNLEAGNINSYPGTGTIWKDLSGNNNNGTLINGPTFNSGNGGNITFSNTSNQSVSGTTILSPSFTVEAIFMPTTMSDYSPVFGVGLNNVSGGWGDFVLHTTATGAIYCGTDIATRLTPSDTGCGPGAFLVNNIYHMTFTFSDGIGTLYKNGVLLKSKAMTKPLNVSTPVPYRFQNSSGLSSMRVYDFRIYNRALSTTEVQQKYNATNYDCGITGDGVQVFPNSATTIYEVLYQSTCAEGEITDGITTGLTITKIGKNGVSKNIITAIPKKGSIFKGWTKDKWRADSNTYYGSPTTLSYNSTISDNTTWYALFDRDCSYIEIPTCYSTDITKLCLSCEGQKNVYFDNKNNTYINNGITNNTYWYGSSKLETLITFNLSSGGVRVGWSFNSSSQELSLGGTFKEEKLDDYDPGCSRTLGTKKVTLQCRPTSQIKYFVYLYKNNVKIQKFTRTGNSDIEIFNQRGNSGDYTSEYKLKYASDGNQSISFTILTNTSYEISRGGFCFGGYDTYNSTFYTRATTASLISPDGYYTQLINGQYSNYNVIYRVYEGQVILVLDCRSDILDCNG
jgi:hypothetical protein